MPVDPVFSFGKHKGQKVSVVQGKDPGYIKWFLSIPNMREKHKDIFAAITNTTIVNIIDGSIKSDKTPEHNQMQNRFLDPIYRQYIASKFFLHVNRISYLIEYYDYPLEYAFEDRSGADVILISKIGQKLGIEIKPILGEDYPTVLREMKSRVHNCLLIGKFESNVTSLNQLIEIFKNERIVVLTDTRNKSYSEHKTGFNIFDVKPDMLDLTVREIMNMRENKCDLFNRFKTYYQEFLDIKSAIISNIEDKLKFYKNIEEKIKQQKATISHNYSDIIKEKWEEYVDNNITKIKEFWNEEYRNSFNLLIEEYSNIDPSKKDKRLTNNVKISSPLAKYDIDDYFQKIWEPFLKEYNRKYQNQKGPYVSTSSDDVFKLDWAILLRKKFLNTNLSNLIYTKVNKDFQSFIDRIKILRYGNTLGYNYHNKMEKQCIDKIKKSIREDFDHNIRKNIEDELENKLKNIDNIKEKFNSLYKSIDIFVFVSVEEKWLRILLDENLDIETMNSKLNILKDEL